MINQQRGQKISCLLDEARDLLCQIEVRLVESRDILVGIEEDENTSDSPSGGNGV